MSGKIDNLRVQGTAYDRRVKLTETDRAEIRARYAAGGVSTYALANEYGVSRRAIDFAPPPERYERAREQFKERRKDGRYSVPTEERREIMREHRAYKRKLHEAGNI